MNNNSHRIILFLPRLIIRALGSLALLTATFAGAQTVFETSIFSSFIDNTNTPAGSLVLGADDGVLYGTANGNASGFNSIFRINRDGSYFQTVHVFGSDAPYVLSSGNYRIESSVLAGIGGFLYGTTPLGGTNNAGTVFKMGRDGSSYTVLHSFSSTDGTPTRLMQAVDGTLYGDGFFSIFSLDTNGNYFALHTNTAATDGNSPLGALILPTNGMLYGTMYQNGSNSAGTIFRINTNGGGFQVLHSFPATTSDGKNPVGSLVQGGDGALYGTTYNGGTNNFGTVYKINLDGSGYTVLYSFTNAPDGQNPAAGLTLGIDGSLYGTTEKGGANGGGVGTDGTIFKINLDGSGYRKLYDFGALAFDGVAPDAGMVRGPASDGTVVFYGTASKNLGTSTYGTVFALVVNPPLSITPAAYPANGNQVTLFWPAWAQGAVLQSTTNLTSGTWSTVSNGMPLTGVQVTNAGPNVYYRLSWPP